jgi:hypothetical protein
MNLEAAIGLRSIQRRVLLGYDPDEARDPTGKWTQGGFGGPLEHPSAIPVSQIPLTPDQDRVELKARRYLMNDLEGAKARYKQLYGNVLDADKAKELFPEYRANRREYAAAVHEPSSFLIKQIAKDELAKEAPPGKHNEVVQMSGGAGVGKCLGRGTPVMLHSGEIIPVESITVDMLLMGPDSLPRKVLSTSNGFGPLYRIVPVKGDPWICNDVHVLTLIGSGRRHGEVRDVPLNEMVSLSRPDGEWKLLRVPIDFAPQKVVIDPYLLGTWLGDGSMGPLPQWTLGLAKLSIIAHLEKMAPRYGCKCKSRWEDKDNAFNVRFSIRDRGDSWDDDLRNEFPFRDSLFVAGKLEDSRAIHDLYLHNSSQVRQAVLAGLLDTDGYLFHGTFEIITKYPLLRDHILFLARSLGYAAYSSPKPVQLDGWDEPRIYSRIMISGDFTTLPLLRHRVDHRRQKKNVRCTGWKAESIGDGEYFGFTLDGDGRFLLGDFTVTHNTSAIEANPLLSDTIKHAQLIYDGTGGHLTTKVDQILAAGKDAHVVYVHGDPVNAFVHGQLPRAMDPTNGRVVPLSQAAAQSIAARQSAEEAEQKYKDNPHVHLTIVDNSKWGSPKLVSKMADLPEIERDPKKLYGILKQALDKEHNEGRVSDEVYRSVLGGEGK